MIWFHHLHTHLNLSKDFKGSRMSISIMTSGSLLIPACSMPELELLVIGFFLRLKFSKKFPRNVVDDGDVR